MFLLLPIGNENSTVQRLPWVTFAIIGLNILIFGLTWPAAIKSEAAMLEQVHAIEGFLSSKPYMMTDDNIGKLAGAGIISKAESQEIKKSLSEYAEAARAASARIPSMQREIDQRKLESMIEDFSAVRRSHPFSRLGLVPAIRTPASFVTSMFLHGGIFHLLGNLLFFFAVGFSLEDIWGRIFFSCFYLIGGVVAAATHVWLFPNSTVPLVGASGAIAAVMGAFLVRFFTSKIKIFYWCQLALFFGARPIGTFNLAAYIFLPLWFIEQLFYGLMTKNTDAAGVAFWAHIGGFVFGMGLAFLTKGLKIEDRILKPAIDSKVEFGAVQAVRDALSAMDRGAFDDAERMLLRYAATAPKDVTASLALVQVYEHSGKTAKVREIYSRLIQQYLDLGEKEAALFAYDNLLSTFGNEKPALSIPPRQWMMVCDSLVEREMLREAAVEYRRLAAHYPQQPFAIKALLNSGDIFLTKLNSPREALASYEAGLTLNPTHPAWVKRLQEGKARATARLQLKGLETPPRPGLPPNPSNATRPAPPLS